MDRGGYLEPTTSLKDDFKQKQQTVPVKEQQTGPTGR